MKLLNIFVSIILFANTLCNTGSVNMNVQKIAKEFSVNSIYEHYSGKKYKLIGICYLSEDENPEQSPHVIYEGLYEDPKFGQGPNKRPLWVRPLKMFFEEIEINGHKIPRFKLADLK